MRWIARTRIYGTVRSGQTDIPKTLRNLFFQKWIIWTHIYGTVHFSTIRRFVLRCNTRARSSH